MLHHPKSTKSRNSNSSAHIQIKTKSQWICTAINRGIRVSRFGGLWDVGFSVETVIHQHIIHSLHQHIWHQHTAHMTFCTNTFDINLWHTVHSMCVYIYIYVAFYIDTSDISIWHTQWIIYIYTYVYVTIHTNTSDSNVWYTSHSTPTLLTPT